MLQYALKRLLLIPPTFFLISILIFLVLNVAPGRPGEVGSAEGQNAQSQRESFQIFKEQFNLDKPILVNTRASLTTEEVRTWLVTAYAIEGSPDAAARIDATTHLDDVGNYLVQHLIVLLQNDASPEVKRLAAWHLTSAARQRLLSESRGDPKEVRAQNREIVKFNATFKDWWWKTDDPPEKAAEITAKWTSWYQEHADLFTYTGGEKASLMVMDTRFAKYWSNLLHLDFGVSNVDRRPVLPIIFDKMRYSIGVTLLSILLAYAIAVPLGIFSAVKQGTAADNVLTVLLFMLYSLPTFFTGTVLLRLLTVGDPFSLFPTNGVMSLETDKMTALELLWDISWHLVLPVMTYTSVTLAALSRYARTGVIDVIRSDYVRTARAKGLSEPVVILKHAARNGMIPILTLLGGLLPVLVSGSVVIEVIFNIPGMGRFLFDSINLRDYNAVMGVLLLSSVLTLIGIFISDLSYALVDPRISFD